MGNFIKYAANLIQVPFEIWKFQTTLQHHLQYFSFHILFECYIST